MRTWTWFHPKPWAPLCAAAPRARLAPCSDAGVVTQTFKKKKEEKKKAWLQFQSLTLATGAWSLLSNSAPSLRCLRTSSPEAKLLLMQDCVHRDHSTRKKTRMDVRTSLIHCDPKAWPIFFIFIFIKLQEILTMPLLQIEWESHSSFGICPCHSGELVPVFCSLVNRSAGL